MADSSLYLGQLHRPDEPSNAAPISEAPTANRLPYWLRFSLLCGGYLAAGSIGLLLQPNDDFGSPFWPAAGVALAGLMIGGWQLWPAIALATSLEAAWALTHVPLDLPAQTIAPLTVAASIGATLQAVAGAYAVRGPRPGFTFPASDRQLAKLFLVAGGICTLINASVTVAALYANGLVDADGASWLWITTWASDATGVFVVTPLILLWVAAPHARRGVRLAMFGLPLLLFVVVASLIAVQVHASERMRWKKDFQRRAQAVSDDVRDQFNAAFEVLNGARGLIDSSETVKENEFEKFVGDYLQRRPALLGVGWLPRIPHEKRPEFEARLAHYNRSAAGIVEYGAGRRFVPAAVRADYFPLRFARAQRSGVMLYGFDMVSVSDWRAAAEQARDRAELVTTPPIPIVQPSGPANGVLAILAVYREDPSQAPISARRATLRGYVAALLDPAALLSFAIQENAAETSASPESDTSHNRPIELTMLSQFENQADQTEIATRTSAGDPLGASVITEIFTIVAAGRDWTLRVSTTEEPVQFASRDRWWLLTGGTLSAALLGAFTLVLASRSARVEELVADRTQALGHEVAERRRAEEAARASSAWLQLAQEAAGVGVWEWNVAKDEVHASAAQSRLYGILDDQTMLTADIWRARVHPDDRDRIREIGRLAVAEGKKYQAECRVIWPDGSVHWLHHNGRIDRDGDGNVVRIVGASWDITDTREKTALVEEQQRRFRALTENSEIGFWQVAPDGRATYLNAALCKLLEIDSIDEIADAETSSFFAPESLESLHRERENRRRGIASTYEATIIGRRGKRSSVMISAAPIFDADGNLQSTIGSYIDITELKEAEARLQASENELSSIYHGVSDAVSLWRIEGDGDETVFRCLRINRAALEVIGAREADIVGRCADDLIPEPLREGMLWNALLAVHRRNDVEAVQSVTFPTGERTFEIRYTPLFGDHADGSHLLVAAHDVTARFRAETELRQAVEFRESIIQHSAEGLCVSLTIPTPPYAYFNVWNRRLEEITGYSHDDVNEHGWLTTLFRDPQSQQAMTAMRDRIRAGEDVRGQIVEITRKDDEKRIVSFSTTRLTGAHGEHLVLSFIDDVTDRERAAEALRASEDRYRGVVTAMAEGVLMVDEHQVIEACNASLCKILGAPESQIVGRKVLELFSIARDEYGNRFDESNFAISLALSTGVARERRVLQIPQPDGQSRWLSANTRPIFDPRGEPKAAVATITDITTLRLSAARQQMHEQQLAHVSRVSTMGEFVAGIAHEINQPLHAIANFASACERSLTENDAGPSQIANALAWTRHISASVRQAGNVIRRLRDFFRRDTAKRERVSLAATVRDSLELTSFLLKEHHVSIDLDLASGDDLLVIDRVQIQQVLVNLLRNAVEAVAPLSPERRRAAVRILRHPDKIEVIVSDSGPGVPSAEVGKLFEPFHTTKPDGMGMGLPISKTIIESHGGTIWYQPQTASNGQGGAFHFTLPRNPEDVDDAGMDAASAELAK